MSLTQKQEELAKAYILHQGNQTQAYRDVYPNSKANNKSLWTLAYKAFANIEVQNRIKELQEMATNQFMVTIETITAELDENRKIAKELEQPTAMNGATIAKSKLHGLMVEKKEVTLDAKGEFLKAIQPTTGLPSDRDE